MQDSVAGYYIIGFIILTTIIGMTCLILDGVFNKHQNIPLPPKSTTHKSHSIRSDDFDVIFDDEPFEPTQPANDLDIL